MFRFFCPPLYIGVRNLCIIRYSMNPLLIISSKSLHRQLVNATGLYDLGELRSAPRLGMGMMMDLDGLTILEITEIYF